MKKASNILLLVCAIVAIVDSALCAIIGFIFMIFGASADLIREGIQNGSITTNIQGNIDQQVAVIALIFLTIGGVLLAIVVPGFIAAGLAFSARKRPNRGLYIGVIVTAALSGNYGLIAGSILGLIVLNKEANQTNVVNAEIDE